MVTEVTEQEVRGWHESLKKHSEEYAAARQWKRMAEHLVMMGVEPLDEQGRCRTEVGVADDCSGGWYHDNHKLHNEILKEIVWPYRAQLRRVFLRELRSIKKTITPDEYARFIVQWLKE